MNTAQAAIAIELSANAKTGPVSATYASQHSCPKSCSFFGSGCYAESGPIAFTTRRLNSAAKYMDTTAIAATEAEAIRRLSGVRPLRIHVVGDCSTDAAARTVSEAASEYAAKHNQPVWSYTHAWRDVAIDSWGEVSVLASAETVAAARIAMAAGWAAAIVSANVKKTKAEARAAGIRAIQCPQQTDKTGQINCAACRLCMNAPKLKHSRTAIIFHVHGSQSAKATAALRILQ